MHKIVLKQLHGVISASNLATTTPDGALNSYRKNIVTTEDQRATEERTNEGSQCNECERIEDSPF